MLSEKSCRSWWFRIDGNFCVDPNFRKLNETTIEDVLDDDYLSDVEDEFKASWGGAEPQPS